MPTHQYVQIPPDGSGKKIFHRLAVVLDYENGLFDFEVGHIVTGEISGLSGTIIQVEGTTDNGKILIIVDVDNSQEATISGENLLVEGVKFAEANGTGTPYFTPASMITGANSTLNAAYVDNRGQLYVRNADGVPDYDIAGKTRVVQDIIMGQYTFQGGVKNTTTISEVTSGSATVTANGTIPAEVLTCQTSPGELAQRTTDLYHKYMTGTAQTLNFVTYMGDSGAESVTRRWGIYDDNNGFFFELNGTELCVVIRSMTTGTAVDTRICQTDWNRDHVDGGGDQFNLSRLTLDLTKTNVYWIEYRGTVGVNFGMYYGDEKVTFHEHIFTNNYSRKMITSLVLPIRWEQFTDSTAVPASISEMYVLGATLNAGARQFEFARTTAGYLVEGASIPDSTANVWTPVMSIRCGQNRKWIFPNEVHAFSNINLLGRIRVSTGAALLGASWTTVGNVEIDTAATVLFAGTEFGSSFVPAGQNTIQSIVDIPEINPQASKLIRRANLSDTPLHMTLEFKAMQDQPAGWVHVSFIWIEV
jgi:hypothetical protein